MRFSHYNRKSNSQLNHSFDNNQSQSFNFSQHVSYLQKNTPVDRFRNYGKLSSNTQISQSQKLNESQLSINKSNNRYQNAEILEQNTKSQILQSKQTFRRASSPKFKLVVKQPKKNKKSEIIEITLPKEAKKFEVVSTSQNKCNIVGSQTNNISAQYSRLSKDQSERSPYSKPFENKKYSEISLIVPKSKPFDSSILYKSNKSKKMNQSDIKLQSYDDDERLVETKDTRNHQAIQNFRNSSSLSDEREPSEPEQPTHFIDLQQLLLEKQKQKFQTQQFDRREQFSFKPSETGQEQPPKNIQNQNSQQEVLPFYTKKQPVQINLNIKQFVNNSESSERTTSSQTLTNNQNQNLSTLTFGKKK